MALRGIGIAFIVARPVIISAAFLRPAPSAVPLLLVMLGAARARAIFYRRLKHHHRNGKQACKLRPAGRNHVAR